MAELIVQSATVYAAIGALVALGVEKKYSKDQAERWLIPISSGIIAGESLMEIVVRVLVNFHVLTE
jgi:uncharacterized oligopeptide transporter (OPT) family protein